MKQIEQEKDVLMQGLQAVERAREWYLKQVAAVQEKMKYLGRMGSHMVSIAVKRTSKTLSKNILNATALHGGFCCLSQPFQHNYLKKTKLNSVV
jgi:predicted deacetylase